MQTLRAGHLARMQRTNGQPCSTPVLEHWRELSAHTVTWLPVSDPSAVAAQLTVSDDLAAAAKRG